MNFKILLIKPNILVRRGFVLQSRMSPPIGLAYVAAGLVKAGYEVEILDMVAEAPDESWTFRDTHIVHGMTDRELKRRVMASGPGLIGIGGFTSQFARIREIVDAVKSCSPEIPVVLGGANATSLPRHSLEQTRADYVIQGEGEAGLLELVRTVEAEDCSRLENIDGLGYRRDGREVVINPKEDYGEDVDAIPWPARELLNHEMYLRDGVTMPVITSRSCPCRCTFCSVHIMSGRKWRPRDPYDVVDEIEDFVRRWSYKNVSIFDDAANVRPERLVTICKEVVRRNLGIRLSFPSSVILRYVTRDMLYWMKKAGAVGLSIPIEHSNEEMRNKVIRKGIDLAQVDRVLEWCRETKLLALANFVIGMPGENEQTLEELTDYVTKTAGRLDAVSVYVATPFPGTRFYDECVEKKYLLDPMKNDFLDFDTYTPLIQTGDLSADRLVFHKNAIERAFVEARGPDHPAVYIRRIFRKPDDEGLDFLDNVYFR